MNLPVLLRPEAEDDVGSAVRTIKCFKSPAFYTKMVRTADPYLAAWGSRCRELANSLEVINRSRIEGAIMHRIEQVFLLSVFLISLFFVWIAFREKPTGFGSVMLVGAIMASSAMICWFLRSRPRQPPVV